MASESGAYEIIGVRVTFILGSEKFKDDVERNLRRRAGPGAAGRPKQCDTERILQ